MKVSLIVPAFNEEKYIGKFLDSVLSQSQIPDEIIICNNNSTDKTIDIINKYQSLLPITIVLETKKGITPAVETAWRAATGDLIIKTDADCILPKDWIYNYLQHYQSNPKLIACGGGFSSSDGNPIIKSVSPVICYLNHILLHITHGYRILYGGNMSIKKSVLLDLDGYQNNFKNLQDDIFISHKIFKNKYQYRYYFDLSNSTSTRRFKSFNDVALTLLSNFSPKFYREKTT